MLGSSDATFPGLSLLSSAGFVSVSFDTETFLDPIDFVNAYTWYSVAVAQGIKTAKNKRDEIISELNEKDLLEAQALSIKLFKKINN